MRRSWLLILLVILVAGFFGTRHFGNAPVNARDASPVEVVIPEGTGGKTIAAKLHEHGVLRSPLGFLVRLYVSGERGGLKAGTYIFTRAESGETIFSRLRAGDSLPKDIAITIPEGLTLADIAAKLEQGGVVKKDEFLAVATVGTFRNEFLFLKDAPDGSLEGYLFPDTYRFSAGATAKDAAEKFLRRFDEQWRIVQEQAPKPIERPIHEIVTMASIVEREVRSLDDRRMVAGILWERLSKNVGLGADATVRYAINTWDRPLTVQDLAVDSPYNTRKFAGLPPGPIGSPGAESLRATLDPEDSDFFYYLSARDGKTIFSTTLEEHNANIQRYLR